MFLHLELTVSRGRGVDVPVPESAAIRQQGVHADIGLGHAVADGGDGVVDAQESTAEVLVPEVQRECVARVLNDVLIIGFAVIEQVLDALVKNIETGRLVICVIKDGDNVDRVSRHGQNG